MSDTYQNTGTTSSSPDDARADTSNTTTGRKLLTPKQVADLEENGRTVLYHTCKSEGGFAASFDALKAAVNARKEGVRKRKEVLFDDLTTCYQVYIDAIGETDGVQKLRSLYTEEYPNVTVKSTKHAIQIAVELILPDARSEANRYSRALRYMLSKGILPRDLTQFLKDNGGIDKCAGAHKELTDGPSKSELEAKKTAAPKAGPPFLLCDAGTIDAITARLDSETKQARADVTFKEAKDGTLIIVSVKFWDN